VNNLARFRLTNDDAALPRASIPFKTTELTLRALRDYHRHEAVGWEHVPRRGGFIIAANHTFATYDSFLLAVPVYDDLGRVPNTIADRLLMRTPVVGSFFRDIGFVEGSRDDAVGLLKSGGILGLSPGGMREALRSSKEKYRIDWRGRTGFVWAAMLAGVPIVLAACPRGDDIYDVAELGLTRRAYERFKVPLALFRGVGPTLVPRPIKLWHVLSEPITSPVPPDRVTKEDVIAHHTLLSERMNRLMEEALDLSPLMKSR
jgi:hypothetical protein